MFYNIILYFIIYKGFGFYGKKIIVRKHTNKFVNTESPKIQQSLYKTCSIKSKHRGLLVFVELANPIS